MTTPVVTIKTSISNAYLTLGERPALIDAGGPDDVATILAALTSHRVDPRDLAAVILTHGHTDHTGAAAHLVRLGVPVVVGSADVGQVRRGVNDDLPPTGPAGRLIKPFSMKMTAESAEPTVLVDGSASLADLGLDMHVEVVGGHTAGSMIVRLDDHSFVGDLIRGGFLAGRVKPTHPLRHYFVEDARAVRRALANELEREPLTLLPGHGGPLSLPAIRHRLDRVAPEN